MSKVKEMMDHDLMTHWKLYPWLWFPAPFWTLRLPRKRLSTFDLRKALPKTPKWTFPPHRHGIPIDKVTLTSSVLTWRPRPPVAPPPPAPPPWPARFARPIVPPTNASWKSPRRKCLHWKSGENSCPIALNNSEIKWDDVEVKGSTSQRKEIGWMINSRRSIRMSIPEASNCRSFGRVCLTWARTEWRIRLGKDI